jgi:rod shape-determining protein MreC
MKRFIKNKFFILAVVLMVIAAAVPTALTLSGKGSYVHNAVNVLMTPLQKGFNYVTDALDGFTSYFTKFDDVVKENARLKEEIASLYNRLYQAEKTEELNQWLTAFLEMKRSHTDFTFAEAVITGRENANYMTVCTIDRGTVHGITEGMPVVTPDGVLGYIDEAGLTWAKVRTLIESTTSLGACIERTGELGLVEGNFSLAADGLCRITYLAADSDVRPGDRVITSGTGGIYPRDLVIGYVIEVIPDEYSRTLTATLRPAATLTDLDRVMITTSYETITE